MPTPQLAVSLNRCTRLEDHCLLRPRSHAPLNRWLLSWLLNYWGKKKKTQLRRRLHELRAEATTASLHVKAVWSLLQWQRNRTESAAHLVAANPFLHGGALCAPHSPDTSLPPSLCSPSLSSSISLTSTNKREISIYFSHLGVSMAACPGDWSRALLGMVGVRREN